jgi:hypothetical protein
MKMKYTFIFILIANLTFGFGQKNELATYVGKAIHNGDVFQLKYERVIYKKFSLQTGFRYHFNLEINEHSYIVDDGPLTTSKVVQQSYRSKKLDLSLILSPIHKPKFDFKFGIGIDIGFSKYTFAHEGVIRIYEYPEGFIQKEYWNHEVENLIDFGFHYLLLSNYCFKNNLFLSGQILYNQVMNEEYSIAILRKSTINLSLGFGYRF